MEIIKRIILSIFRHQRKYRKLKFKHVVGGGIIDGRIDKSVKSKFIVLPSLLSTNCLR